MLPAGDCVELNLTFLNGHFGDLEMMKDQILD